MPDRKIFRPLFWVLLALCLAWASPALATDYVHPASKLVFPYKIAGMERDVITKFANTGLGVGISYKGGPGKAFADVYIYDGGLAQIRDDCLAPEIKREFETGNGAISRHAKKVHYQGFRELGLRKIFLGQKGGGRCAWEARYEYEVGQGEKVIKRSFFVLTAKRDRFIKLRFTTIAPRWDNWPDHYNKFLEELGRILEQ